MSLRDQLLWRRKAGTPLLIAVLGVFAGLSALVPWVPATALLWVSVLGLLIGLASVLLESWSLRRRFRDAELTERNPVFAGVTPFDRDLPDAHVTERGTILYSAEVNRMMRGGHEWSVHMRAEDYRLPRKLMEVAPYILRRTTAGSLPFNGRCVRMLGDIRTEGNSVVPFQAAGFYDHLCSNELMKCEITPDHEPWDVRREYLYDEDRGIFPLASSELANVVGVSTLAVSSDSKVLIIGQSPVNHVSQGLLAPSGSGSLEPKDFAGDSLTDRDLRTLMLTGANREFFEETGVPWERIGGSALLGYGRWLERGAKPEFFGVTLLHGTAEEIDRDRKKIIGDERLYTRRSFWCSLYELVERDSELRPVMSVPLAFTAATLQEALSENPEILTLASQERS